MIIIPTVFIILTITIEIISFGTKKKIEIKKIVPNINSNYTFLKRKLCLLFVSVACDVLPTKTKRNKKYKKTERRNKIILKYY